ncbi:hypothetical protein [Janthinobacterium agaricidamnosum]|uniref:Putative membrane protein n=1 Tax=Janthinobacterium agaricidamnosum NBRC 102515 = DSM 9628 TaxID=1349767 RepID=W0VDJ1_9BURK|nr:hypothetical protein [Janthinobacterium agaricidamnosum]CDG85377.1 putative membrane protein [Janthinobacterium agaricidamnosum NBRC 102515 = DSM 9628]
MKKFLTLVIVLLIAMLMLKSIGSHDMMVRWDGDDIGGPAGALIAMLFAGGGLIFGVVALLCAALFTMVVLAGVSVLAAGIIAMCVLLAVAFSAPLLLPLLIVATIVWLVARNRKQRNASQAV